MFFRKRRERKRLEAEFNSAVDAIYEAVLAHVEKGGEISDFIVIVLWEAVDWDKERQSWCVDVLEGGPSGRTVLSVRRSWGRVNGCR